MPKAKNESNIKKYTPETTRGKKPVQAKIILPLMPVKAFKQQLDDYYAQALLESPDIARARGTVTMY